MMEPNCIGQLPDLRILRPGSAGNALRHSVRTDFLPTRGRRDIGWHRRLGADPGRAQVLKPLSDSRNPAESGGQHRAARVATFLPDRICSLLYCTPDAKEIPRSLRRRTASPQVREFHVENAQIPDWAERVLHVAADRTYGG
jgi:hypothetical protein